MPGHQYKKRITGAKIRSFEEILNEIPPSVNIESFSDQDIKDIPLSERIQRSLDAHCEQESIRAKNAVEIYNRQFRLKIDFYTKLKNYLSLKKPFPRMKHF